MGLLKVVISFVAIGLMDRQLKRDHPDTWTDDEMWKFEIPAAILAAGWRLPVMDGKAGRYGVL